MRLLHRKKSVGFSIRASTPRSQMATMILDVGQSTGGSSNKHMASDQWLHVVFGSGEAVVSGKTVKFEAGDTLLVEAGEAHEVRNTGDVPLETINIYAPPEY